MDQWIADVRYALRRLMTTPAFTSVALVTLALSIGANTAIYSVVDALMLKPLPYRDAGRLTELAGTSRDGISTPYFKPDEYEDWRAHGEIFEQVERYANRSATLVGEGEPESVVGAAVSGGLMRMLGVAPQLGRTIEPADAQGGRDGVVVLSDDLWRRRFAADPEAIGRTIELDDRTYEIVGVMPRRFNFPYGRRLFWLPLAADAGARLPSRANVIGRIRADLTMAQAQVRADAISARLVAEARYPAGWKLRLGTLLAGHLNRPVKRALYVLAGAVALVLLIACANIANLLLLQGAARRRELAVRAALGASRRRLVRQMLTETLLLAAAGGAAGLIAAQWGIDLLAALAPQEMTFLSINEISLDGRVLAFAVGLTGATALLFGLVPALRGSSDALAPLAQRSRTSTGAPRQERLRRAFVLVQLALSLMLLVGAGLLIRTFVRVTGQDPGFDHRNLIAIELLLPRWKYPTEAAQRLFDANLLSRIEGTPGIVRASIEGGVPPAGGGISFGIKFEIEGRGVVLDDPQLLLPFNDVSAGYFELLGIPLRAGRVFGPEDTPNSPKVMVIGEEMARRLWKGDNPVGQRIRLDADRPWYTVVGVVGDVYQFRHDQPRGQFAAYYPASQAGLFGAYRALVVRTAGDPAAAIAELKRRVWEVDPEQPISKIDTIESAYSDFFATPRFYASLMATFAAIGLAIACIGLYGVLAYATAQRTREFGIRIALGASARDVLRLVLRAGAALTAGGLVAGIGASLLMTRLLESLLVEVSRADPWTYAAVTALLASIALAAAWIPARRATRIDPAVTLRYD